MRIEYWNTADGDRLELHRLDAPPAAPRLLILHGLEGSPRSHYVQGLLATARGRGWAADVMVFRSCGGTMNRALRSYHSGETGDLDLTVSRLSHIDAERPLVIVGVSLGGNVLLKWLGENRDRLPPVVAAAAAISVPYDLERGARHIDQGFSRVYQRHFLRTLRRKAIEKQRRFPGALDESRIRRARTIEAFDDAVTAPIHGFRDAHDYYGQSSALRFLRDIRVPTLLLSARDDPFLPADVLDDVRRIAARNSWLEVEFPTTGGHVGFVAGTAPWKAFYYAEWRVVDFLQRHVAPRVEPRLPPR